MATLLTDNFESYGLGFDTLNPPWDVNPSTTQGSVEAGVGRSGSKAVSLVSAMQILHVNPGGGIVPYFDATVWAMRTSGVPQGFDPLRFNSRTGLEISMGTDVGFIAFYSDPDAPADLAFYATSDPGAALTVPNVYKDDVYQKFRMRVRLSTVNVTGTGVNADGCAQVWVDDVSVVALQGLTLYATADWTSASSPNRWEAIYLSAFGYVDDVSLNNNAFTCPVGPVLPPVPIPPTPDPGGPQPPCVPKTHTGNGGTGNAGCNTGGSGYIQFYNGPFGSVPHHTDPTPGESMVNAKGVDLWVEIVHQDYPSGARTTHRRAMLDLADAPSYQGGLKSGGLLAVGDVEHGLGNEQGGFEAATVEIAYADSADRLFRNLLLDQELEGDEVRIKLATIQGRLNAVAPRVIARAVAQKPKLSSSLHASFSASDYLFSEFGPFGPGRQFPSWLMPESIFPYASADSLKLALPVLYGEKSDHGAIDPITGVFNSKGLVPLLYVGPTPLQTTTSAVGVIPLSDPNVDPPPEAQAAFLFTPVGQLSFTASEDHAILLRYDVKLYASGTVTPVLATLDIGKPPPDAANRITVDLRAWLNARPPGVYDVTVTAVSGTGSAESGVSNTFTVPLQTEVGAGTGGWFGPIDATPYFAVMTVYNGHASRLVLKGRPVISYDATPHNFRVTWTEAPQAAEYYVFMYTNASWDAYTNPYVDATVRYKRVPAIPPNSQDSAWDYYADWTSPADGAAWPPVIDTGVPHADVWDTYVLCGHAIFDVIAIYGSDLGNGDAMAEQQRILLDPNTRGDILCPFFSTWPFPTTYRDFTADDGSVYRMTVIYARGPLSDAHKNGVINMTVSAIGVEDVGDGSGLPLIDAHACQQHWIENFLINNYRTGLWVTNGTHPQWDDGTAMVRSSSFARLQAFGQSRIGGRGLTVGWYSSDQKVLQDWFREWNTSTDSRLGINGDGQIVIDALDETVDTSAWPRVRHETDLFGDVIITSGEERENVVSGVCDWDPDTKAWRGPTITYESQHAIAQYKGRRKQGTTIESTILVSERQLRWVLLRRLTRLQDGTKTVEITGKVDLLDYDVGSGILLTTIEGTGTGYVDKPLLILRRRFKVSDRLVTLTLLDLDTFLVPLDQVFSIGDDTISLPTGNPVGGGGGNPGGGGGGGNPGGGGGPGGGVTVGLPVVPGAAGWGMETRAAYGSTTPTVYRVTTLADSGAGSLRAALEASGPRVVLFETSGYIPLASMITISSPYITIAAQTAPSPGIALKNYGIIIDTHDVLLQHFRVRPGGDTCNNAIECFSANVYNVVLDHMSVSWGQDENIVFYNPSRPINATAWMCITAEGLHNTPGTEGCPGAGGGLSPSHGMLIYASAQRVTVARTLFALNVERNPYAEGDTIVGYYNNLVYAWTGEEGFLFANFDTSGGSTGGPWHATAIGNRFIPGPGSVDMFGYSANGGTPAGNTIYRSDNTASSAITVEQNDLGYDPNVGAPPSQSPVPTGYAPMPSSEMETLVLNNSGARPTDRDGVDQRILDAVSHRTGTYVVHQDDVGGWPALAVHTRTLTLPANPHTVLPSGYTNLEVWLHQYADVVEGTSNSFIVSN